MSQIANGVRVYQSHNLQYLEYSIKDMTVEYAMAKVLDISQYQQWQTNVKDSQVISQLT